MFAENDFVDPRILDKQKVEQRLNVFNDLKGEAKENNEIGFDNLKNYDKFVNWNFGDMKTRPVICRKFDGSLVIKK